MEVGLPAETTAMNVSKDAIIEGGFILLEMVVLNDDKILGWRWPHIGRIETLFDNFETLVSKSDWSDKKVMFHVSRFSRSMFS